MHKHHYEYKPLIIVAGICVLMALAQNYGYFFSLSYIMYSFMAYFLILLSLFKFFDLAGFASSFGNYDLITQKYPQYGYIYPFIELGLGLGYLMEAELVILNWATLVVMLITGASVLKSVKKRKGIKCACMGTVFNNIPLSRVSLFENFGMAAMAAYQLICC